MYWKETLRQMSEIGVGSLIIVCLILVFIGAVAAIQFAYQLDGQLIPQYYIGYIVRDLALIELSHIYLSGIGRKSRFQHGCRNRRYAPERTY